MGDQSSRTPDELFEGAFGTGKPHEKARNADTSDEDPRDDDSHVYNQDGVEIHPRSDDLIQLQVPKFTASVTDARALRDALDVYLGEDDLHDDPDDTHTVEVKADTANAKTDLKKLRQEADEATAALKRLQRAIDGLGGETGHTSTPWTERLTGEADGADDAANDDGYGTPAPSPSDVQERMEEDDA